jgi:hypothetical protein
MGAGRAVLPNLVPRCVAPPRQSAFCACRFQTWGFRAGGEPDGSDQATRPIADPFWEP